MEARNDPFSWQRRAACKDGVPSSVFYEEERIEKGANHSKEAYKSYCNRCPVRSDCLDTAILYNFEGVWGGYTDKERREYFPGYREQLIEDRTEIGTYKQLPHIAA